MNSGHVPVMLEEVLQAFSPIQGTHVDGTFGRGGHTQALMAAGAKVIAFDHDIEAIEWGKQHFADSISSGDLTLHHANFAELPNFIKTPVQGMLFDFGVSSIHLDSPNRGFSFQHEAPLDMRMDMRLGVTARDLVNALGKNELIDVLIRYAQEFRARPIVAAIMHARESGPIQTTTQLADIVEKAVGGRKNSDHLHPATKTFMALRLVVNDELPNIQTLLPSVLDLLADCGTLVTISFHEGEDRLVKHAMQQWTAEGKGSPLTKKPMQPSEPEIQQNPRSRSAKMRVFKKEGIKV